MRQRQPLAAHLDVAQQQQVDVDRTRAVARAAGLAAPLRLNRLADVEQRLGLEVGPDPNGAIQEVGLVEDLPYRRRLIQRRRRFDGDAMNAQPLDRPAEVFLAIADVGAEAEISDALRPAALAQRPSSSSGSRSSDRSSVTSTPASWTT